VHDIISDIIDWDQANKTYLAGAGESGERYLQRLGALPLPADWGAYSVATEREDRLSFLPALRLRRDSPALGLGTGEDGASGGIRWLDAPADALIFARDPGFVFAANLGGRPLPLPPHREVLLASGPLTAGGALPRDTAVWLAG